MSLNNVIPADVVAGGVYRPGPETRVTIDNWSVREVTINDQITRHLCGTVAGEGRVCSPIQDFDSQKMEFTTRSGKVYEAIGWPRVGQTDAEFVWSKWCSLNGIKNHEYDDVTKEYV